MIGTATMAECGSGLSQRAPAIRRGYVDGRHGQLHYRHAAAPGAARRPLVLLHQNPASSLEYEPLIAAMATDRHVVAFDTPGYGMSDDPPAALSMADYAACFVHGAAQLGLTGDTGCDVFGVHTGALLAIEFALAAPNAVRHIVCSGIPMRSAAERADRLQAADDATGALDEAGAGALALADPLWNYIVAQRTPGVPLRRAAQLWVDKLAPIDRASWAYQGVWSYDYEARLPLIRQPFLLLQPPEEIAAQSRDAAALVADAQVVEIEGFRRDILELPQSLDQIGVALRRFLDSPLT
jgi:pimeloyl-ACP methyl ester carboxylesterase